MCLCAYICSNNILCVGVGGGEEGSEFFDFFSIFMLYSLSLLPPSPHAASYRNQENVGRAHRQLADPSRSLGKQSKRPVSPQTGSGCGRGHSLDHEEWHQDGIYLKIGQWECRRIQWSQGCETSGDRRKSASSKRACRRRPGWDTRWPKTRFTETQVTATWRYVSLSKHYRLRNSLKTVGKKFWLFFKYPPPMFPHTPSCTLFQVRYIISKHAFLYLCVHFLDHVNSVSFFFISDICLCDIVVVQLSRSYSTIPRSGISCFAKQCILLFKYQAAQPCKHCSRNVAYCS